MPKLICAEVNEIFRNLCQSSCAEVRLPDFERPQVIVLKPQSSCRRNRLVPRSVRYYVLSLSAGEKKPTIEAV